MSLDYATSGVNIERGNEASKMLYEAAKKTFENRDGNIGEIIVPTDDFSGLRVMDVSKLPKGSVMCMGFDGVGTKVEIAQRMNNHRTIAFDLLAMVCDDAIVRGAEPVIVGSVLDVNSLGDNLEMIHQLCEGYVNAAKAANVAVINGELAELGDAVGGHGSFKYNWCSALVWFANKKKLFTGKEINVGDSIVVFQENGFRSNGLSLVRKTFQLKHGDKWHLHPLDGEKLGTLVLEPSTIYCKALVSMHGGFQTDGTRQINGVAHITGGGLPEKLGRIIKPSGFGAELTDLYDPCKAMKYCQEIGEISDKEAYKTWNMGQGLAVITPEPEKVIDEAKTFGINAMISGKVIQDNSITLKSHGIFSKGEALQFHL